MRPCRQCRAPIENHVGACPQCGTAQDDGPKVNSGSPPPASHRGFVRQLLNALADITGLVPALAPAIFALPLVAGGLIGYLVAESNGAVIGATAALALLIGIAIWAESGG
ncbi:hypothetical protein J8F10_27090 [Gemmata sp. G18]|uniref:Zinc ribbon domain-containing protein n=1 Tax=Gemmata palustris TaxID=2822762 RepID=A0ABS5BYY2_9BACT|nr:hypothetical protein [Gemmata palustris]MBP3958926.1 hypothetical protein [Gemmata palustris]